jgi:LmbE family N-acetylglucosaminyl deacetylase
VCVAHPDDEVIGCGATIAKYAEEGEEVIVVIFSYGQSKFWYKLMHPDSLLNEKEIITKRIKETKEASEILGVKNIHFLGLTEFKFKKQEEQAKKAINEIIKKHKPRIIIYHSVRDAHDDHLFVNKIMKKIISKLSYKPRQLRFQVNLWDFFSQEKTCYLVDVSKTFKKKMKALKKFKSQSKLIKLMLPLIRLKSAFYGKKVGYKHTECFYE